jgi:mercuric ion transport protein
MRKTVLAGAGGVLAASLGSLCCMGPLLFVTLGVGAGLASTFEPLRPLFAVAMLGLFAIAFYTVYGRRVAPETLGQSGASTDGGRVSEACATGADCAAGEACAVPRDRRREKVILWSAALLALVLWTLPTWSRLLI